MRHLRLLFILTILCFPNAKAAEPGLRVHITLREYLRMVLERNESIQAQLLGTESARQRALAEYGAYEPELAGSAQHTANKRPNTVEQQRNLAGIPILDERNNLYDLGIENLTPLGGKVRLGYTLNNFNNNLTPLRAPTDVGTTTGRTNEWQSFFGLTVTQPLLKNGGPTAALAALRLAANGSESAFQEYRRQLMVTLAQAGSAYWGVYFAQEQLRFLDESVGVAESILADSKVRATAGKGAELDVLEAEAGLALRRTKRNDARQKYTEARGQLLTFAGRSPRDGDIFYLAADDPSASIPVPSYGDSWGSAIRQNPDYLLQKKKLDEALIRLAVARNQRLPELNAKASYGYNGLGDSPSDSVDETLGTSFLSWSAGLEMRVPLGGGIRGRHEYAAILATVDQIKMQVLGVETQLANALTTSIDKLRHARASASDYRTMIRFNENLLKTERDRLGVGKVEGRRVLEVEAGLFEVKQGLADALVQAQRAALELHLAEGSVLAQSGIDFTPAELRDHTAALLRGTKKPPLLDRLFKKPTPPVKPVKFAPSHLRLRDL